MKKPSSKIITFAAVALSSVLAIFYFLKAKKLDSILRDRQEQVSYLLSHETQLETLLSIDSLVFSGDYEEALSAYEEQLGHNMEGDDRTLVSLRVALLKNMIAMQENTALEELEGAEDDNQRDTLDLIRVAQPMEVRKYDSLSFALEKTKLQVRNLQLQLRQKSSGEYLTFTSSKGAHVYYVGQVKNDMANGKGVALLKSGSRYEGDWKNNERHGNGTFYWPDGQVYKGSYREDRREGQGTYYWPNGEKYIGAWENDQRNGEGTFYDNEGKVMANGIWKNDKLAEKSKKKD